MGSHEKFCDSLPYIDDAPTDVNSPHQYNIKLIENYHNKNRNIEITNRYPKDFEKPFSPPAPLADETELSDNNKLSDSTEEDSCNHDIKYKTKESGMKLVIKGWDSSVSIQGLDNKSSITFERRCEKVHKKLEKNTRNKTNNEEPKPVDKSKKGKWKMLTRSIMLAKSARCEKKGSDERYPKYVLLKNEEEELITVKENYPKMFLFNEGYSKQKTNAEPKTDFSFKKSFKNKTEPIVSLNNILDKNQKKARKKLTTENINKQKQAFTERNVRKKKIVERKKTLSPEKSAGRTTQNITVYPLSHGQVYSEIQNIIEDTLQLLPQNTEMKQVNEFQQQAEKLVEYHTSVPSQYSCHHPYCCTIPHSRPQHQPIQASQIVHKNKNENTQFRSQHSCENQQIGAEDPTAVKEVIDLESLPYGILSSFFPRVVIMNAISSGETQGEDEMTTNGAEFKNFQVLEEIKAESGEDVPKAIESLEVPQQDLTLKSKTVQQKKQFNPQDLENFSLKEFSELDEDQKTKSQDSVTTEYLQYNELNLRENESEEHPNPISRPKYNSEDKEYKNLSPVDKFKTDETDENSENLSLTKIGYKMYDNLTKLSLNREKEMSKKAEASGCGCNGNGTKKSPYNITLQSNNSVVKVTVPENELNFQIFNSEGTDIQIGVMSGGKGKESDEEIKKVVRKDELWLTDDERRALGLKNENSETGCKGSKKLKVSLADNKEVVLSIELKEKEKEKKEEKIKEKLTREMKVGTDDFDVAGGDFVCALDGNYQNLSPRIGQLLKLLHEKLEADGKERKFLDEKINEKLIDQKFQKGIFPGVFLVKHISPRPHAIKKPTEVSSVRKSKSESCEFTGQLREYYCEECLATMRIFEDENPSVKSMVDKFETIIQLESY